MTKGELIKGLAELKGVKKKEAEEMISLVDEIIEFTKETAKRTGQKVKLGKYIVAEVVEVEAKSGVAMGKEWHKPAHKVFKIKQVKSTKEI